MRESDVLFSDLTFHQLNMKDLFRLFSLIASFELIEISPIEIFFFYFSRKKYWFRKKLKICFLMDLHVLRCSEKRFDCFWKMSVCMWQKNMASIVRELIRRISWNFIVWVILTWIDVNHLLVKESLNRWHYSFNFSGISGITWSQYLVNEIT